MLKTSIDALALVATLVLLSAVNISHAETPMMTQLVPSYGRVALVENPGEKPDPALDYKVVLSVTKAGEAGAPPPALEKAARLANLLAQSGVPANHRHIIVVLHGPATMSVLTPAGMTARGKGANPSEELIAQLKAAGVRVDVCGQALAGAKIARGEVLSDIQVDLSALTTLSTLQLKGYALIPD